MNIARIELPYSVYDNLTIEQVDEIQAAWIDHPIFNDTRPEFESNEEKPGKLKVKGYRHSFIVDLDKIFITKVTVECRLSLKQGIEAATSPPPSFNEHVQVMVPGNAMLRYNKVKLAEDCCTDALQDYLNEGWRIMAVCPQPQRRPDYILGREEL